MTLLNLSMRERKLFYITVIAIILWTCQALVIKPLSIKWRQLDDKLAADRLKLEKGERLIAKKNSITDDYGKLASTAKMAGSAEEEMAVFLTEIESLGNTTGVHINEIKPLPMKQFELYRKFYADLELEGEISQISDFMRNIQDSPHMLVIDKLSLGSKQAGTSSLKCRVTISKLSVL